MSEIILPPFVATAMAERLIANAYKDGWEDIRVSVCLRRAERELREMRRAILAKEPPSRAVEEMGDVCNYLAMAAMNYRESRFAAVESR